ncbi:MAG: hypothetical protein AB1758_01040 [Candidatus Eremiobacterota bacterium]
MNNGNLLDLLDQARTDLMLSYQCLSLEQATARGAEQEALRLGGELRLARASLAHAQGQVAQYEEMLRLSDLRLGEALFEAESARLELRQRGLWLEEGEEALYRAHDRLAEAREREERLTGRLEAAQERIRELEEMLSERPAQGPTRLPYERAGGSVGPMGPQAGQTALSGRHEVDGWMASFSLALA